MLAMNEAELDFCLEMYALDHPKEFKFERPGQVTATDSEIRAAWDQVLDGAAREARQPKMPSAVLKRLSEMMAGAVNTLNRTLSNANHKH